MKEVVLTPFAPILVESTRSIGYSFEAALADIIDNSIGKSAKKINIDYRFHASPYIAITDDACGMSEEELEVAMRYGSKSSLESRDEKDLGRFGLGLKVASLSQCRKLTVVTKQDGRINAARWDLDHVISRKDWILLRLEEAEINDIPGIENLKGQVSGTIVLWEDFDRLINGSSHPGKIFDEKIEIATSHLALVYHRFIGKINGVQIYVNNVKIEPLDPFLENNAATQPLMEQEITIENSVISVKPFILPYASKLSIKDRKLMNGSDLKQSQGFYVYRNKRLIVWGTWFRLIKQNELNKLARVRVDIPNTLDSIWELDVKKSTASLPDVIKKNLVAIVESTVGKSEKVYKYRGRNVSSEEVVHVWNSIDDRGKLKYQINKELPMYKALEESLDDTALNYLDSFILTLEDSFPYGDIYYRVAKNEMGTEQSKLEYDRVYQIAVESIDSMKKQGRDIRTILQDFDKYEFFQKYPDVVNAVRVEYADE